MRSAALQLNRIQCLVVSSASSSLDDPKQLLERERAAGRGMNSHLIFQTLEMQASQEPTETGKEITNYLQVTTDLPQILQRRRMKTSAKRAWRRCGLEGSAFVFCSR